MKDIQYTQADGGTKIMVDGEFKGWLLSTINGQYTFVIDKQNFPNFANIDVAKKAIEMIL